MRICLLADAGSVHTQRWAAALADRGHVVTVLSLRPAKLEGVEVIDLSPPRWLSKMGYLAAVRNIRGRLAQMRPDLLHAHYASSYGLLGSISGFSPLMISAWGADVFDFPGRSPLNRRLLRFNFRHADIVACTSRFMKAEVERYTDKPVEVTPFGVDTNLFRPPPDDERRDRTGVTIGLVKALEEKYGVTVLVQAFELLARRHADVRLVIVGDGTLRASIRTAIERSSFVDRIRLLPAVPHSLVPRLMHEMDIFAVPSIADSESFGVAAIEASACALPVVASRVGGLTEVVIDGVTGTLVPPHDANALAAGLEPLVASAELRRTLGANGRAHVERVYDWRDSVDAMERLYTRLAAGDVPNDTGKTKVAIVTSHAPHGFQERFVLREGEALGRVGLEPILVPVRAPASSRGGSTELRTVVLGLGSPRSLLAVLRVAAQPLLLARLIRLLLSDPRPRVLIKNMATLPLACHLARFVARAGVSHIHAAWASTPATVALLASELTGLPWSFSAHRWDITEANLVRAKVASARFARAVSERGRLELAAAAGHLDSCPKIVRQHLGVDVAAAPHKRSNGNRPFTVVSVGNLIEKKGHAHVVRSAALLRERGLHFTVCIVGEGPERRRLEALINRLDLSGTVRLEGQFSGHDVDRLLATTDVFVQPSVVSASGEYEGIPVALIEAMAAGCPVVASRSGSIEELVTADAGLTVPPGDPAALADAIETLATDPELALRLGAAGRARVVADFDEERVSAELVSLILAQSWPECECVSPSRAGG